MSIIQPISRIFCVLLVAVFMLGITPAQAQTVSSQPGLSPADWTQISALMPTASIDAQQAYVKASNTGADDEFGTSIAISGDTLVVGSWGEESQAIGVNGDQGNDLAPGSGAVYVFTRTGNDWSQQAYIKASNTDADDHFGGSIAISGDTLVVGASGESSQATGVNGNQTDNSAPNSGAAYVFTRSGNTWSQQAYLKPSNTDPNNFFGISVSIDGDTLVVGAWGEESQATDVNNGDQDDNSAYQSGAAYVFTRSGSTWSQQAYIKASNTDQNDFFGASVSIDGDTLVVGAFGEAGNSTGVNGDQDDNSTPNSGAVYVFTRSGSTWSQQAYLKASDPDVRGYFGRSLAISGETLVAGAPNSGYIYIFTRSGTIWSQQAYLKASNTGPNNFFGASVSIDGDTLVVGAWAEESDATGVNGNQTDYSAPTSGAAYVFSRYNGLWGQEAYVKASNTGQEDSFGLSVAISGDTLVAGAPDEDSDASGVNGNQANDSATDAGAVYVLKLPPLVVYSFLMDANPTHAASVNFNVAFSEPMTGVDANDFALATTGDVTDASITNVSGGPNAYTVTVATGSGEGAIILDVLDDDSIVNQASATIPLGGVGIGNGSFTAGDGYTIDRTPPTVEYITCSSCDSPNADNVNFAVYFSEHVTGVDASDFTFTATGSVTGAFVISASSSDQRIYTVTVGTGLGTGTLRLDVSDHDSIVDLAGNPLGGLGAGNGDFSAGAIYTMDKTPPTAQSITRASPNPTSAVSVDFNVTFSKPVTGVDATDFSLASASVTGAAITNVSSSDGTVYAVTVSIGSGNGTIRLDLADDDSITDAISNPLGGAGTGNGSFTSGEIYTVDKTVTLIVQSSGAQDGWVLESGETSKKGGTLNAKATTFKLGDDAANKQYLGILSFSTGAGLPDNAVITGVTLKVRKQGISGGGNPLTIFQGFMLDIKQGFFGAAALQTSDFQAKASKSSYGPFKPALTSGWYSINLTGAKDYVNKLSSASGLTQIRLRFKLDDNNNALTNTLNLFSGNAPAASRPQLIINYYLP